MKSEIIIAIDPGPTESAFVLMRSNFGIMNKKKVINEDMLSALRTTKQALSGKSAVLAIEMVASTYGMTVGAEVFQTCFWAGRFVEAWCGPFRQMNRSKIKAHICGRANAKDKNVRAALIERFGPIGTKRAPGFFYGFHGDLWQAYAVGVTAVEVQE